MSIPQLSTPPTQFSHPLAITSEREFWTMGFPGRVVALRRVLADRNLGIPVELDAVGITQSERSELRSLCIRNSWIGGADTAARKRLLIMGNVMALGGLSALLVAQILSGNSDLWLPSLTFLGGSIPIAAWNILMSRTSWQATTESWDTQLGHALERLSEMFDLENSDMDSYEAEYGLDTLGGGLEHIKQALDQGFWLDDAVWQQLGPVDSLGMIRLAGMLRNLPDTLNQIELDGDTMELVSRVGDIAETWLKSHDDTQIRISAMKGIEALDISREDWMEND